MITSILLKLTPEEKTLLRSTVTKLGTKDRVSVSLQLKIANAILESDSDVDTNEVVYFKRNK
jgi:hypothetical protein